MCGIIGYNGNLMAPGLLIEGLERLEYRGYDSAGIAVKDSKTGSYRVIKEVGKVAKLKDRLPELADVTSTCGIGHTRWATHGGVCEVNAHPHTFGRVVLLHNGIIENHRELVEKFGLKGKLKTQTDTEIAAAVFDAYYKGNPKEAIRKAVKEFIGTYAFCIMFVEEDSEDSKSDEIYAIRSVSPLVATLCDDGAFISSDITALIKYTNKYFVVPENHIVTLGKNSMLIEDMRGHKYTPEYLTVDWDLSAAQKGGYKHYMMKEIMEQPDVIAATIHGRIADGLPSLANDNVPDDIFKGLKSIQIVACGTAMHAGMVFKAMVEPLIRIPVTVNIASEFRYQDPIIDNHTLVIAISQSGETIDTLEALRLSKRYGATTLSVVNVQGSSIARESDYVVYTYAGPEIAVASTKAYTVQIATLYLIGCRIALANKKITVKAAKQFIHDLEQVPAQIKSILDNQEPVRKAAKYLKKAKDAFFIGRGNDYSLSLEGSLKLKEISYIHAEAYAAGELKHGTIALITDKVPVIAVATQRTVFSKTISNIREVNARGAYVILILEEQTVVDKDICKMKLTIPETEDVFSVFPTSAILQLIAYYAADARGLDVDMPRNLAKSVTVE